MLKTIGTIIPHEVFDKYREDIRSLGISYISNFNDPKNDHFIVPMPKTELVNNLAEKIVDLGYMTENELAHDFTDHLKECEIEISINIKYITITEEELF